MANFFSIFSANILLLCFCLIPVACTNTSELRQEQIKLTYDFGHYFQNAFTQVGTKGKFYSDLIQKDYQSDKDCGSNFVKSDTSSIYFPKSIMKGRELNCLLKAEVNLDNAWDQFYKKAGFISWQYVYDDQSKSLRIHPATNTLSLFGDNLTFETFNFYRNAVDHYPLGSWYGIREDINGTGKIIIYSQAFKLKNNDRYTVVGMDINADQVLRPYHEKILSFGLKFRSPHVFLKSYLKKIDSRVEAHDFSTNPQAWSIIKATKEDILNVSPEEQNVLEKLEEKSSKNPLGVEYAFVFLRGDKYLCTMTRITTMEIYTILCNQR